MIQKRERMDNSNIRSRRRREYLNKEMAKKIIIEILIGQLQSMLVIMKIRINVS